MKNFFLIIISLIIVISLNSCSKSDDSIESDDSTENIEGLRVTINGNTRIFNKVWVDQFVYENGTINEYTSLIVRGEIEPNSIERINFSLLKGKTGLEAISHLQYFDSNDRPFYYDRSTNGGSFSINVTSNDINNKLLKGKFNGTLQQNAGGIILTFKNGSFNIQY
jgi:hypothetical protein